MTETKTCNAYPSCIGGLDAESEWCNSECPEHWLRECVDRMIENLAPSNALEIMEAQQ